MGSPDVTERGFGELQVHLGRSILMKKAVQKSLSNTPRDQSICLVLFLHSVRNL